MISSLSGTTRISPHANSHHAAKTLLTLPGAVGVCTCPQNMITSRHLLVPGPPGRICLGRQPKVQGYKALADISGMALLGGVLCWLDICLWSGQKKGNGSFLFLWVLTYLNLSHKYCITLSHPRGGESGLPFRLGADRMVPRLPLSSVITSFVETAAKDTVVHQASHPPRCLWASLYCQPVAFFSLPIDPHLSTEKKRKKSPTIQQLTYLAGSTKGNTSTSNV